MTYLPITDEQKDGRFIFLFVDYSTGHGPLEDSMVAWTIGFNSLKDTGEDYWNLVGWSWEQDHFLDGQGEVLGWYPMPDFFNSDSQTPTHTMKA